MIYWGLADDVATVVLIFGGISIYLAYGLTNLTGGAPRAWYLIISAFAVLFITGAVDLYFDVQKAVGRMALEEQSILLVVVLLFTTGLFMLTRTFRENLSPDQRGS